MAKEIKWTDAQEKAITIPDKTILVSAAAGSGKTATLTERIIRRITNKEAPADISKMLIVTFTRASAADLREKIFSALSDALAQNPTDNHLASQLMKLSSTKICTIDSFYFDIIKANSSFLGISSTIRIADSAEYMLLAKSVMEKVIDEKYETDPDFPAFVECFATVKQSAALIDIFLKVYDKLCSVPSGIEFIKERATITFNEAENDFFDTSYGEILYENTKTVCAHYLNAYSSMVEALSHNEAAYAAYGEAFEDDLVLCKALCEAANDRQNGYSSIRDLIFNHSFATLKRLSSKNSDEQIECFKEKRNEFKDFIKSLKEKSFSKDAQTIKRAMLDTAKYSKILYELLLSFEGAISKEKERLGILTFSDIRRKTLDLLVTPDGYPTDIAKLYSEQFSDIYIDEYQDVDEVQDLIFSSIAKANNRFMVGDIKQSIYEFRGAEPKLFASYLSKFPAHDSKEADNSDSVSLFMSENFRCDKNIIDFTNLVCSKIFYSVADSMKYSENDELKLSKNCSNGYVSPKVKVVIVQAPSKKKQEATDLENALGSKDFEVEYIAQEIANLLANEKKANGEKILPKDIAVLFRAKAIGELLAEALKKRGILSSLADSEKYFENPEVLAVLCVLNAIDNPQRDIFLAGALRSPLFNFTMDELVRVRIATDKSISLYDTILQYAAANNDALSAKCQDFISTLESWQDDATALPVDRFLQGLFDSERFVASGIVSQSNDNGEGGNLLLLYEYARGFEGSGFKGLYQFIEYINSLIEKDGTISVEDSAVADDRVRLMTIHKSKGLEFPVCFLCNASASIRSKDVRDSLVLDYPTGIAMKISAVDGLARINTPMRETILSKVSYRQAQEEMRLLYVALTRARERLYVTAATTKSEDQLLKSAQSKLAFFDKYTVTSICQSYLDWVLLSCNTDDNPIYEMSFIDGFSLLEEFDVSEPEAPETIEQDEALTQRLKDSFSFEYPYKELSRVPSKISVSRLYPDVLDETQDALELFAELPSTKIPDFFLGTTSSATAAERGTATHLFLQFCDFRHAYEKGVSAELERLEAKKFLPPNAAKLIYVDELERFFKSELIEKILSADKIIREQRFNIEMSPEGFTSQDDLIEKLGDEKLAVQGVIDLILIDADGQVSLYDYKTDRLSRDELSAPSLATERMNERHARQLSYYAKAAELLFGKKCSRVAVYSTHSARIYDII